MSSESPGKGILFQGTVTSTNVATVPFSVSQLEQASFQIKTDGVAAVNYTVQASNVPAQASDFGPPYRSDSAASPDWSTISTGSTTTSVNGASTMASVSSVPYRAMRVILSSSGSAVTVVYAFGTGASS